MNQGRYKAKTSKIERTLNLLLFIDMVIMLSLGLALVQYRPLGELLVPLLKAKHRSLRSSLARLLLLLLDPECVHASRLDGVARIREVRLHEHHAERRRDEGGEMHQDQLEEIRV